MSGECEVLSPKKMRKGLNGNSVLAGVSDIASSDPPHRQGTHPRIRGHPNSLARDKVKESIPNVKETDCWYNFEVSSQCVS
jgi:hypothetical protein